MLKMNKNREKKSLMDAVKSISIKILKLDNGH